MLCPFRRAELLQRRFVEVKHFAQSTHSALQKGRHENFGLVKLIQEINLYRLSIRFKRIEYIYLLG